MLGIKPCQRRIPGDVNMAIQEGIHLHLIVGIVDHINGTLVLFKKLSDNIPNNRNFWVVKDCAYYNRSCHQKSSIPQSARPMKSYAWSLVGAMTMAARASRKNRSRPRCLLKAAPPQARMPRSVTCTAASDAAAFTSRTSN